MATEPFVSVASSKKRIPICPMRMISFFIVILSCFLVQRGAQPGHQHHLALRLAPEQPRVTRLAGHAGMANLLKYALGLKPLVPLPNTVVGDITTGYLRLTTPKNPAATDVNFFVEVAGNVEAGWTTNDTTIDQNTSTLLQAHYSIPVSSSPAAFIRLRVSRP